MIILDASVAVKLLVAETDSAVANDLFDSAVHVSAPAIVRIEVAGAVLRRHRLGELREEHARDSCNRWDSLLSDQFIHLIPNEDLFAEALDLSFRIRHLLTDCLYIAAAMMMDCPLITADVAMQERGLKVHDRITLLAKAA